MAKNNFLLLVWILSFGAAVPAAAAETAPPAASQSEMDRQARWESALEDIQMALDEDPDEAARFLGATPVQSLELEELETLSEKARLFVQQKELERLQDQQEERRRIRELQELQRSTR